MHSESTPEYSGQDSMKRLVPLRRAIGRINAHYERDRYNIQMRRRRVRWLPLPCDKINRREDSVDGFADTIPAVRIVEPIPEKPRLPWYRYVFDWDSVVLLLFILWAAYLFITR